MVDGVVFLVPQGLERLFSSLPIVSTSQRRLAQCALNLRTETHEQAQPERRDCARGRVVKTSVWEAAPVAAG